MKSQQIIHTVLVLSENTTRLTANTMLLQYEKISDDDTVFSIRYYVRWFYYNVRMLHL